MTPDLKALAEEALALGCPSVLFDSTKDEFVEFARRSLPALAAGYLDLVTAPDFWCPDCGGNDETPPTHTVDCRVNDTGYQALKAKLAATEAKLAEKNKWMTSQAALLKQAVRERDEAETKLTQEIAFTAELTESIEALKDDRDVLMDRLARAVECLKQISAWGEDGFPPQMAELATDALTRLGRL